MCVPQLVCYDGHEGSITLLPSLIPPIIGGISILNANMTMDLLSKNELNRVKAELGC